MEIKLFTEQYQTATQPMWRSTLTFQEKKTKMVFERKWTLRPTANELRAWTDLMLYVPELRKDYLKSGKGKSQKIFFGQYNNKKCTKSIKEFYDNPKKKKFKQYKDLKTDGIDGYSYMRYEYLCDLMTEKDVEKLESMNFQMSDRAAIMKWYLRGLTLEDAIRKIKVDLEVKHNAETSPKQLNHISAPKAPKQSVQQPLNSYANSRKF